MQLRITQAGVNYIDGVKSHRPSIDDLVDVADPVVIRTLLSGKLAVDASAPIVERSTGASGDIGLVLSWNDITLSDESRKVLMERASRLNPKDATIEVLQKILGSNSRAAHVHKAIELKLAEISGS